MSETNMKGIRTVQRSIDIINCFSLEETELSLTEIANKINLAKSTTTRLLATLEQNSFVQKDPSTFKFRLGKKLYFIGHIAGKSMNIKEVAQPIMEQLRNTTNETVSLYLLDNYSRVCVQRYGSHHSVRYIVKIGEELPLWAGAGGKVLLAYQAPQFIDSVLQKVESEEWRNKLESELALIQKEQYAVSIDERGVGVSGIATPIFDINGMVNACLSVSGPSSRFTLEIIEQIRQKVKAEGLKISSNMGYQE